MSINVFEPKSQYVSQKKEIINAVKRVFKSGNYILGKEVLKLEKTFSALHQNKYGIAVKNGTDAISISLNGNTEDVKPLLSCLNDCKFISCLNE